MLPYKCTDCCPKQMSLLSFDHFGTYHCNLLLSSCKFLSHVGFLKASALHRVLFNLYTSHILQWFHLLLFLRRLIHLVLSTCIFLVLFLRGMFLGREIHRSSRGYHVLVAPQSVSTTKPLLHICVWCHSSAFCCRSFLFWHRHKAIYLWSMFSLLKPWSTWSKGRLKMGNDSGFLVFGVSS